MDNVGSHPIFICSDSRAALMALDSFLITSKEVLKFRELLKGLAVNNLVNNLLWVPGHSDILGNEKAGRLATRDSQGVRIIPCSVDVPSCYLGELLKG